MAFTSISTHGIH